MDRVFRPRVLAGPLAVLCLLIPSLAAAQSLGLGVRGAFVRGDDAASDTARAFYYGALIRARTSPKTALELAIDYRKTTDQALTQRTRDIPIQASLLLYPIRSAVSVYLLGGAGWYHQRIEAIAPLSATGTTSTSRMGYHAGLGGELELGRHAALHVDYRYTMIHLGGSDSGSPGAVPVPGTTSVQEKLKFSHQGSMWTTGVTVYF